MKNKATIFSKKSKEIAFVSDANKHLEKALDITDSGDIYGGLVRLRHALVFVKEPFSALANSIRLEIAESLAYLDLFEESNEEFFRLLAYHDCAQDAICGLIKNYSCMENPYAATKLFRQAIKYGFLKGGEFDEELLEEFELDFSNLFFGFKRSPIRVYSERERNCDILHEFNIAFSKKDYSGCHECLEKLKKDSPEYSIATSALALGYCYDGKEEEALRLCEDAIKASPDGITAMCVKLLVLSITGEKGELKEAIKNIEKKNISSWPETIKLAHCFSQIDKFELSFKYVERALESSPYDLDLLILKAITLSNLTQFNKAKAVVSRLLTLFPLDPVVQFLASDLEKVIQKEDKGDLGLAKSVDDEVELKKHFFVEFNRLVATSKTDDEFVERVAKKPVNLCAFLFVLKDPVLSSEKRMLPFFEGIKVHTSFLLELLLLPSVSTRIKYLILLVLSKKKEFAFVTIGSSVEKLVFEKLKGKNSLFFRELQILRALCYKALKVEKRINEKEIFAYIQANSEEEVCIKELAFAITRYENKLGFLGEDFTRFYLEGASKKKIGEYTNLIKEYARSLVKTGVGGNANREEQNNEIACTCESVEKKLPKKKKEGKLLYFRKDGKD